MQQLNFLLKKGFQLQAQAKLQGVLGLQKGQFSGIIKQKKDLLMAITMPTLVEGVIPFLAQDFANEVLEQEYPSFRAFLEAMIRNRFEFAQDNGKVLKIYFMELMYHDELRLQFADIFMTHVKGHFDQLINYYKEKGELNDMPNSTIMRALITNVVGFLLTRFVVMPDAAWEDEQEVKDTVEYILNGLAK